MTAASAGFLPLLEQPHREARRLVATGAPVFVLVNPIEYHGPHLSLRNDRLVSWGLIRDAAERIARAHPEWPFLVGADLELGVDPAPGPGSCHTSFQVLRRVVRETCRGLVELGARRVVLMTFHGSPLQSAALEEGVRFCLGAGVPALAPLHLLLSAMIELDDPAPFAGAVAHVEDAAVRERLLAHLQYDFHAGFFETSMALHYAPESVSPIHRELPPCPPVKPNGMLAAASRLASSIGRASLARELRLASVGQGWGDLRPFPGYTSEPAFADARAGRFFADVIGERFHAAVEAVLERGEAPPRQPLAWIRALTLGGRLRPPTPSMSEILALPAAALPADAAADPAAARAAAR